MSCVWIFNAVPNSVNVVMLEDINSVLNVQSPIVVDGRGEESVIVFHGKKTVNIHAHTSGMEFLIQADLWNQCISIFFNFIIISPFT